jgi:hypothetical protein
MPKRVVKPYRFEAETERRPLTPGQERRLLKLAIARAPAELQKWRDAEEEKDRFYAAPRAAMAAYTVGEFEFSRELAHAALTLAPTFKDNWNYGNAIHFAHTALGLLELRQTNLPGAVEHLRLSGDTPGSPQLDSFGPSMRLARDLLRRGQAEAVLAYLRQCRRFWKMGEVWLNMWERKVERGAVPTFFMQLYR